MVGCMQRKRFDLPGKPAPATAHHSLATAASRALLMKELVACAAACSCCLASAASPEYCFTRLSSSFASLALAASSALAAAAAPHAPASCATAAPLSGGLALSATCSTPIVCSFQTVPPAAAAPGPPLGAAQAAANTSGSSTGGRLALSTAASSSPWCLLRLGELSSGRRQAEMKAWGLAEAAGRGKVRGS